MASEIDKIFPKPLQGFKRIHKEVFNLVEDPTNGLPYQGGASLTPADVAVVKIAFELNANTDFWQPSDYNTRCALEETFSDLDTLVNEPNAYRNKLIRCHHPTIEDAYSASTAYSKVLEQGVYWGMFQNEALLDSSGDERFRDLRVSWGWSHIYMESRVVFGSLGHPHITILSVQPQRASSQKELLCTEFWTLSYWAQKLARRALHTTKHCLPMRLVSVCGYEARVVSAVFSLDYPRSNIKGQNVGCRIHIAEYRDLSIRQHLEDLMEELVATPCGNADVQQRSPGKKNI